MNKIHWALFLSLCLGCRSSVGQGAASDGPPGDPADGRVADSAVDVGSADAKDAPVGLDQADRDTGDAGGDRAGGDGAGDLAGNSDGPVMCNGTACGPGQMCVRKCFCGGAALCSPRPDSGVCPSAGCLIPGGGMGCQQACDNPPPACASNLEGCPAAQITGNGQVICACPP